MGYAESFSLLSRGVTGEDVDGNDVYGETQVTVRGAFAPAGSTELVQGQSTVITHDTLYLVECQKVPQAQDEMLVRGIRRQVDGTSGVYHNPFTDSRPGAVVRLVMVTG